MEFKKGDKVKIIGGNNDIGQPTMIDKIGTITSIGKREYIVNNKKTNEVYVNFKYYGEHVFNDYHLKRIK